MSGVFPPGIRPDEWRTLGDHHRRIQALEAVRPAANLPTIRATLAISAVDAGTQIGLSGGTYNWDAFDYVFPEEQYLFLGNDDADNFQRIWMDASVSHQAVYHFWAIAVFTGGDGSYRQLAPYHEAISGDRDQRALLGDGGAVCRVDQEGQFYQDEFAVVIDHDASSPPDVNVVVGVTLLNRGFDPVPPPTRPVLTWSPSCDDGGDPVTGFNIYRGTSSGGETLYDSVGVVFTYEDLAAVPGTTYFYYVTAVNGDGESAPSNEMTATA